MGLTIGLWDSRVEELDGHVAVVAGFARTVGPQDGLLRSHFKGADALAVTVAASMCFASPFSTPPNALVMSAGSYKTIDYIKVGLPLQIVMAIVMIIALPMIFPF